MGLPLRINNTLVTIVVKRIHSDKVTREFLGIFYIVNYNNGKTNKTLDHKGLLLYQESII